ncbi:biotin transport system substrate-specific component [Clostridium tetanomorphum]|uniref:Biotin transporter n=1 Tax=Clostridium tetanomorphum TaxID=1553 RepID=A0A923E9P4_CLOTT|nr:biotin transporter BioY [Clostridium tetanomorphum]KAJ53600.1 hypothetical protein CTM_01924 [Clostridium tetanomorphum DSM 665]MBC2397807.1 biotin transporter BioY [Clostridium tetanomorphum]MBP1864590.1 biotin transport system substrate-specific component [Clostridium tetanomorphum]NRS84059.1 biotin transport system substrate-specific component [Clostridium tetanomorphum]NRZ97274.1 biotin transport system substrate-specific component [Clostridium tetanomorphum]
MKLSTKDLVLCGMFAAITGVVSQISIPIHPIPFTLQVFAVYLTGIILGYKKAFISQLIYVALGAVGVPLFSNFRGGIQSIVGPTGGFIIAFPFMALIVGYFFEKSKDKGMLAIGLLLSLVFCYTLGTIQLSIVTGMSILKAINVAVLPFVLFDLIKIFIAYIIGLKIKSRVNINI